MAKIDGGGSSAAKDFVKGFVVGSNEAEASAAQVAGDIAGALVPGLGEIKAVQDIWEGTQSGNPALVVGGLVGLIPVVGAVGKAGGKAGSKAAAKGTGKIAAEVGKGLATKAGAEAAEQSFKISAMKLGQVAQKAVEKSMKDPRTKERMSRIAHQTGERGLQRLVDRLTDMKSKGESPEVYTRRHSNFSEARDAAFGGLGGKPAKDWNDLVLTDDSGRRDIVGRHENGERGFRILASPPDEGQAQGPLKLYWWKGAEQGDGLKFGVEECDASPAAVKRIQEAYLNRNLSFRRKLG